MVWVGVDLQRSSRPTPNIYNKIVDADAAATNPPANVYNEEHLNLVRSITFCIKTRLIWLCELETADELPQL